MSKTMNALERALVDNKTRHIQLDLTCESLSYVTKQAAIVKEFERAHSIFGLTYLYYTLWPREAAYLMSEIAHGHFSEINNGRLFGGAIRMNVLQYAVNNPAPVDRVGDAIIDTASFRSLVEQYQNTLRDIDFAGSLDKFIILKD